MRQQEPVNQLLSERECEVLRLIGHAKSNQEIADELFLSVNSVKTHVRMAYRKIGVHSRAEAVLWAHNRELSAPADETSS